MLNRGDGSLKHSTMESFPEFIRPGTVAVFNDTRVRKCRIYGYSSSGGNVEFLLLKEQRKNLWEALVRRIAKQKEGKEYNFPGGIKGKIEKRESSTVLVRFDSDIDDDYLERYGHIPLPPYIKREDTPEDELRYQTVYSKKTGSVAAPTAGLHFNEKIIEELKVRGIEILFVTLHVGLGTFTPIRTEEVENHRMHREEYEIDEQTANSINKARREGRKILAVGTTTLRAIESAYDEEMVRAKRDETDLYIYPGYRFKVVDQLLTNFHAPESSLLALVMAFSGKESIQRAYREAALKEYRFFSYGDAMLIL